MGPELIPKERKYIRIEIWCKVFWKLPSTGPINEKSILASKEITKTIVPIMSRGLLPISIAVI